MKPATANDPHCVACPKCKAVHDLQQEEPERVEGLNEIIVECSCGHVFEAEPRLISVTVYRVKPGVRS